MNNRMLLNTISTQIMIMQTLTNQILTLKVFDHGAEIKSLKKDNNEYMWQGDPAFWGRTAPLLFPFVGSLNNKEYIYKDNKYPMGQHGFARDMDFALENKTETSATFVLSSNDNTKSKYPFDFKLKIRYELVASSVKVSWTVENTGNEILPFSIGGHPAFNCDMNHSKLQLLHKNKPVDILHFRQLNESGLVTDDVMSLDTEDGNIQITDDLFQNDALIIENSGIDEVKLFDSGNSEILSVKFDTPVFGLWSPKGKQAPFVCIEPWFGMADEAGFSGTIKNKKYIQLLKPNDIFNNEYIINICR